VSGVGRRTRRRWSSNRVRSGLLSIQRSDRRAFKAGLNFIVPLCIQIGQVRTPLDAAIAMMPFT